jgi:hypothetical protein
MARGLKISRANSVQIDQAIKPQTVTYADSNSTTVTHYVGGTGGFTAGTTSLVIQVNYKDKDGNAYTDGQIVKQKGSKTFLVQSVSGGAATLSRVVLTPVAPGSLAASQCSIKGVGPAGNLFYAARITDRFVFTGGGSPVRYIYTLGNTAAVTYIDTTSGVSFLNSAGGDEGPWAVVEGF